MKQPLEGYLLKWQEWPSFSTKHSNSQEHTHTENFRKAWGQGWVITLRVGGIYGWEKAEGIGKTIPRGKNWQLYN